MRPAEHYINAHRDAERVALTVIASAPGQVRGRHDVWELLASLAPELAEWAAFFGYLSTRVEVAAAGEHAIISRREADDLVRDVERFTLEAARRVRRVRGRSVS